jgi:hypothetical protein
MVSLERICPPFLATLASVWPASSGSVSRYVATEQKLPQRLGDLELPLTLPEQVSATELDPSNGSLRIRVAKEPDGKRRSSWSPP